MHRNARLHFARLAVVTLLVVIMAASTRLSAQTPGCTFENQVYTCDKSTFLAALDHAKSIAIDTSSRDRNSVAQMRRLIQSLGKSVAPAGGPSDLTLLLAPVRSEGVNIGPAGVELATVRLYTSLPDRSRGNLLWAETLSGQPDTPWPLTVRALLHQFAQRVEQR